jgi:hypothetical protein
MLACFSSFSRLASLHTISHSEYRHCKAWMKEEKGIRHRGEGPTYSARSLPQHNSSFATRVLLSTYVCVKGEKA